MKHLHWRLIGSITVLALIVGAMAIVVIAPAQRPSGELKGRLFARGGPAGSALPSLNGTVTLTLVNGSTEHRVPVTSRGFAVSLPPGNYTSSASTTTSDGRVWQCTRLGGTGKIAVKSSTTRDIFFIC